jgi:hypothetical protein
MEEDKKEKQFEERDMIIVSLNVWRSGLKCESGTVERDRWKGELEVGRNDRVARAFILQGKQVRTTPKSERMAAASFYETQG